MCFGKRANALHAGLAAIGIFPYKLVAIAIPVDSFGPPAKHIKVQNIVFQNHRRRGPRAIFARTNGEHKLAFRAICVQPAGGIGAVIVNNARSRDHRAVAAWFNALDMFAMATRHGAPKPANVVGTLSQGLGAFSQYRQRKMRIAKSWRVTFRNIDGVFAGAVKRRFRAIVKRAAIADQRCQVGGKWRAFAQKSQSERADKDKK